MRTFERLKKLVTIIGLLTACAVSRAQDTAALSSERAISDTLTASVSRQRQWIVGSLSAAAYGASLLSLNAAWYKDYPKTSFHTFDDSGEWLQVDKVGHAWSVYNLSRASTAAWLWASKTKDRRARNGAVLLGSASGFGYLTVIEFLDAHSANWGWSWPDIGANFFGTSLFAAQELGWGRQRVQFKFSAHRRQYAEPQLEQRANMLFGATLPERLLKDYNNQTYWMSANLKSFFPASKLPAWLNVSIGYGAEGLFGGYENTAQDKNGNTVFDRRDIRRRRQWYLSPDVDLTRIKTHSKFLRTAFSVLNSIKVPAPAIEFSHNRFHVRALVF